jgi:hypothetical protein
MINVKRAILVGAVLAVTGITVTGCDFGDKANEPFQDAGRTETTNGAPVEVITNADGFSNATTKCDHGNRLYFAYHGDSPYAAIAVVPRDPTCKGDVSINAGR